MANESLRECESLPVPPDAASLALALERTARELATIIQLSPSTVRVVELSGRIVRTNANADGEYGVQPPGTVRELWERDQPRHLEDDRPLAFLECPAMRALAGSTVRV